MSFYIVSRNRQISNYHFASAFLKIIAGINLLRTLEIAMIILRRLYLNGIPVSKMNAV